MNGEMTTAWIEFGRAVLQRVAETFEANLTLEDWVDPTQSFTCNLRSQEIAAELCQSLTSPQRQIVIATAWELNPVEHNVVCGHVVLPMDDDELRSAVAAVIMLWHAMAKAEAGV